jgi:ketosteroid isomerase-like protein
MDASTELEDLTRRFYDALSRGDISFIEHVTSKKDEFLMVGTDPDEWWADRADYLRIARAQLEEVSGVRLVAGDLRAHAEGAIGWVTDRPSLLLPDGSELHMRLTAVYHRDDAGWKLIHAHHSLGVSNEQALGRTLTT